MAGSTLSDTITVGITLGSAAYPSPLTITPTGAIAPSAYAVAGLYATISAGYVLNQGSVAGGVGRTGSAATMGGTGGVGVVLASGSLTNDALLTGGGGGTGGAGYTSLPATIVPGGYGGTGSAGVDLTGGSLINNGTIVGGIGGVGGATPDGITGDAGRGGIAGAGVDLIAGGLTNNGTIVGGAGGSEGFNGAEHGFDGNGGVGAYVVVGSLTNTGTIVGGSSYFGDGQGGVGVVFAGGGTLIDAGVIGGGGNAFNGFGTAIYFGTGASRLILDPGASLNGGVVADAAVSNVLELADTAAAGTIAGLGDSIIGFGTIAFDPGAAWFVTGNAAGIAAGQTIDGFTAGDMIELTGFVETGYAFASGGLILSGAGGAAATIGIQGAFTTSDFSVSSGGGNSVVELGVPCFAAGTRIAAEHGEVAVEDLVVGDKVRVLLGSAPAPIIWIGRRTVDCARHKKPAQVWPVRVRAGAFGPGRPHRDLFLSPDHAVYFNEVLIPVRYLLTGTSIAQVPVDAVTYFHLELSAHDVLLAEGVPAESYLETGDRANFVNRGGVVRHSPDFSSWMWEAYGCAKLIVAGAEVTAAQRVLAAIEEARHDVMPRAAESLPGAWCNRG
jgi:collagen type I/II/III/V/XI/XXIV/XXVII alpha